MFMRPLPPTGTTPPPPTVTYDLEALRPPERPPAGVPTDSSETSRTTPPDGT